VAPVRSVKRPLNVILGWLSTSKKSALRRCASRSGSPVQMPAASISPSNVAKQVVVHLPETSLHRGGLGGGGRRRRVRVDLRQRKVPEGKAHRVSQLLLEPLDLAVGLS
jgi:hypothetical protein